VAERMQAARGESPFVWGRPIDRDEDFVGREVEVSNIEVAIRSRKAVQILGGAKVGRTSLLRWFERHPPGEGPIARLSPGQGLSPVTFVAAIAEQLGKGAAAEPLRRRSATMPQTSEVLAKLVPFVLLLDDADTLATHGEGFGPGFFDGVVRGFVENGQMKWISVSRQDLCDVLKREGLGSKLLDSSERVWVGPLEERAAQGIAKRAGARFAPRMVEEAGQWAYGLQWLGDRLHRMPMDGDLVFDQFEDEARRMFGSWWEMLSASQRQWLKRCLEGTVRRGELTDDARRELHRLVTRKLVFEREGVYRLAPGNAWARFIRDER